MKLSIKAFSLASAVTFSIWYIICAFFIWVAPVGYMNFVGYFFHGIDFTKIASPIAGFGRIVLGLILTFITAYIIAALLAWFYNRFASETK